MSDRSLFVGSGLCAALVAASLLVLGVSAGISQGAFQIIMDPAQYVTEIRVRAPLLRLELGLDSVFIAAYTLFFIQWASINLRHRAKIQVRIALAMLLGTAILDAAENAHLLAIANYSEGSEPSIGQLAIQQTASQVKFHLAHIGILLLALTTRFKDGLQWVIIVFLAQLVAGLLIFVTQGPELRLLYLFRAVFFAVSPLILIYCVASASSSQSDRLEV